MLDAPLRKLIDWSFAQVAARLARYPVSATGLTIAGFAAGLAAIGSIATHRPLIGLGFIVLNRLLDGLDGPLARATKVTDLGAYLDIVFDFIFYAGVPFAFALADPGRALAACFLILSFVGSGTTFLAYAIFAAKHGISNDARGPKSLYYLGGLTEGTETFLAFALACFWPEWFSVIAYVFGALCFVTTGTRIATAVASLK
jgi:phosphatidylglycerophosphate synthase